jgi:hypothetical protein
MLPYGTFSEFLKHYNNNLSSVIYEIRNVISFIGDFSGNFLDSDKFTIFTILYICRIQSAKRATL